MTKIENLIAKKKLLVTGRPGVGKTTLIIKAVELSGLRPRGFYTEEIREQGVRKGFRVKTFGGTECVLSHTGYRGVHRIGRYGVDVEAFEDTVLPELLGSLRGHDLVVIDEIGKMELLSKAFRDLVMDLIESSNPILGVLKEKGNGFVEGIKDRADVVLYTLTPENREQILDEVLMALKEVAY